MRKHKYGVAPKDERTFDGTVYHSKAEAFRATELDLLLCGKIIAGWDRQVEIPLGEDFHTVVDFMVSYIVDGRIVIGYEEIKGYETPDFKRVRKLWKKYGPADLLIMKRSGKGWKVETITPDTANTGENTVPAFKNKTAMHPKRSTNAVNIDPKAYEKLTKIAKDNKRPIKTQLEIIIEEYDGDT
jgi:hypothetical protein